MGRGMRNRSKIGILTAGIVVGVAFWMRSVPLQPDGQPGGRAQPEAEEDPNSPVFELLAPETAPPPSGAAAARPTPSQAAEWAEPDAGSVARGGAPDEQVLLTQVRALVKSDPARAEALARESRERYPQGESADERDALMVDALVNQERIGAARDETYYYFRQHPGGRFAEHLFAMTGARPAPQGPGR